MLDSLNAPPTVFPCYTENLPEVTKQEAGNEGQEKVRVMPGREASSILPFLFFLMGETGGGIKMLKVAGSKGAPQSLLLQSFWE